jgi:hypothetical protein
MEKHLNFKIVVIFDGKYFNMTGRIIAEIFAPLWFVAKDYTLHTMGSVLSAIVVISTIQSMDPEIRHHLLLFIF